MTVQDYFEALLRADEGDKIFIPCCDGKEQESIRTRLFHLRREFGKTNKPVADTIQISKTVYNEKLFVVITRAATLPGFIMKANGSITEIETASTDLNPITTVGTDITEEVEGVSLEDAIATAFFNDSKEG